MLHRSSPYRNTWNRLLAISLLVLFILNGHTTSLAQTKTTAPETVKIGQNVLRFVVTKDTRDSQLESIKEKLADRKATLAFKDITRNDRKEITAITITFSHEGKNGNYSVNSDAPIQDIAIMLNVHENTLTVGPTTTKLSQSFVVYTTDDDKDSESKKVKVIGKDGGEHEVKKEKKVYVIKSGATRERKGTDDVVFVKKNKRDTVWVKNGIKNLVWTDDEGDGVEIIVIAEGDNFQLTDDGKNQPLMLLDGKEIQKEDIKKVDPNTIQSVSVLKSREAIKKYGEKGKHGAVEIVTDKN